MKSKAQLAEERYPYFESSAIHISNNDLQDAQRESFIAGYEADKWIDVKEKLPEDASEPVLVWQLNYCEVGFYGFEVADEWCNNDRYKIEPTHWQPLPAPPKTK